MYCKNLIKFVLISTWISVIDMRMCDVLLNFFVSVHTEKTKSEKVYVTLKMEKFTVSVRNTGCKRKQNKLKSISVCVH